MSSTAGRPSLIHVRRARATLGRHHTHMHRRARCLAGDLTMCGRSTHFLPMVLGPLAGVRPRTAMLEWCHLSHRLGEVQLKRSNRLVLLIGIFLALIAFVLILLTLGGNNGPGATPTAATTTTYVVATRDIKLGATITGSGRGSSPTSTSRTSRLNGIKLDSLVIGQIARANVIKGQAVTTEVLTGRRAPSGTSRFPPGYVAMAVQVDQVTGVGTIIKAGDYVDMVTGVTGPTRCRSWSRRRRPGGASPKPNATPPPRAGYIPEVRPTTRPPSRP